MLPGNMPGNMLPVSRQHISLCIQQQTGNKLATIRSNNFVDGNKQHVAGNMLPWCKRGLRVAAELGYQIRSQWI